MMYGRSQIVVSMHILDMAIGYLTVFLSLNLLIIVIYDLYFARRILSNFCIICFFIAQGRINM